MTTIMRQGMVRALSNRSTAPRRGVRVPRDEWDQAKDVATEAGRYLTEVITDGLTEYAKSGVVEGTRAQTMRQPLTADGDPVSTRSFRMPGSVWDPAKSKATEQGVSMSDVVRRILKQYVHAAGDTRALPIWPTVTRRGVRVPRDEWDQAKDVATEAGRYLTEVITDGLTEYAKSGVVEGTRKQILRQMLTPAGDPVSARPIRIPDSVWDPAKSKATEQGEWMSDVVRRILKQYVAEHATDD